MAQASALGVATRTRATEWILEKHPERLVAPEDPDALCAGIIESLQGPRPSYQSVPNWPTCRDLFEQALVTPAATDP